VRSMSGRVARRVVPGAYHRWIAAAWITVLICSAVRTVSAAEAHCQVEALGSMSSDQAATLIRQQLSATDYDCAVQTTLARAAVAGQGTGSEGVEGRFALRELALDLAQSAAYPADTRVRLLNAAATTELKGTSAQSNDEIKADVSMLSAGMKVLRDQREYVAQFDTAVQAIHLDMRLPASERYLNAWQLDLANRPVRERRMPQLIALMQTVRGDPQLKALRAVVGQSLCFLNYLYDPSDDAKTNAARAAGILALVETLTDVPVPQSCTPGWYWHPILTAGVTYFLVGDAVQARVQIERALQILHGIPDPNERLGQYRFALTDLTVIHTDANHHVVHYDKEVVLALIAEMRLLTDSLDTQLAREQRAYIDLVLSRLQAESY
jgi:hypothetical protein